PADMITVFSRTGGVALGDRHPARLAYRLQELRRQAAKFDRPMNPSPAHFPTNPAPAAYAIIAAQAAGGGDLGALVDCYARACWEDEADVARDDVVRAGLSAAGFDPGLADSGLLAGAEAYAANTEEAVARGVFGAPFYIVGEELFWGQDRIDDLDRHLGAL
ncbi:MAG: DsbA family protein, partial [Pseudomonadota bacterium]